MVEILFNWEMRKKMILVLIFFSSCSNVKQDKSVLKKSENITHYSHEDSLRLKEGLLPMCLDWNRDSVIFGIRDKFGTWKKMDDTTSNLNVVENIYYSLHAENKDLIRKEIQKKNR